MSKVVLISGASRGIGLITARLLHEKGYTIFGTGRKPDGYTEGFRMLPLDVRDEAAVKACVDAVIAEAGRIDVLINNAGYDLYGAVEDTPFEAMFDQVDTNFFGAVRLTQRVLPCMRQQGGGKIINVSSLGGLLALPFNSAYAASKYAIEGFTESLRYEVLPANIYTSLIEPGQVKTDTLDTSIRGTHSDQSKRVAERAREAGRRANLMAEEVAHAIVHVVETPRPRLRYPVGGQTRISTLLKQFLPERFFEAFIMRQFVSPVIS
jgi:NAD(P)-dependent dehydrogenase (short-subunit alcohol dehydrogenase family)